MKLLSADWSHVFAPDIPLLELVARGTARAQYHLRQMMIFLNMFPVNQPEVMIGNATERFDEQGNLTDETTKGFIRQLLQNLVDWTRRIVQEPQGTQKQ
jgi:NAD(P)H-dependent FMN reductase